MTLHRITEWHYRYDKIIITYDNTTGTIIFFCIFESFNWSEGHLYIKHKNTTLLSRIKSIMLQTQHRGVCYPITEIGSNRPTVRSEMHVCFLYPSLHQFSVHKPKLHVVSRKIMQKDSNDVSWSLMMISSFTHAEESRY